MTLENRLLEYLSAYNSHDVNKLISFLHPDCRVIYEGQVWVQGIDGLRPTYEKDFTRPQAKATLLEYRPVTNDECIRVLIETDDQRRIDVTYVFNTKEKPEKMIEHIIHSLEFGPSQLECIQKDFKK
jgi:hypothetical protein